MQLVGVRQFRKALAYWLAYRGRLIVTDRGQPVKALVSPVDAKVLEALEEAGTLEELRRSV